MESQETRSLSQYSTDGYDNEALPEDWIQSYYNISIENNLPVVRAVFENIQYDVVIILYPTTDTTNNSVEHQTMRVYPLYTDMGIQRKFSHPIYEIEPYIESLAPNVQNRDENKNAGPYKYRNGTPMRSLQGKRTAEGVFSYQTILPQEAIDQLKTYRRYPLDYTPLVENLSSLRDMCFVYRESPETVPETYDVDILISHHSNGDESYLKTDPATSSEFINKALPNQTNISKLTYQDYSDNQKIATVTLNLHSDEINHSTDIQSITSHIDTDISLRTETDQTITQRVKNMF